MHLLVLMLLFVFMLVFNERRIPNRYLLSAKGAAFIASLGQRPRIYKAQSASAESATHFRPESRFQRFVNNVIRIPGAVPQAHLKGAVGANRQALRKRPSF